MTSLSPPAGFGRTAHIGGAISGFYSSQRAMYNRFRGDGGVFSLLLITYLARASSVLNSDETNLKTNLPVSYIPLHQCLHTFHVVSFCGFVEQHSVYLLRWVEV